MSGIHETSRVLQTGAPLKEADGAVVLLHGRGASADDILGLAPALGMSNLTFVAPEAAGNTWYPYSFLSPREQNEPYLTSALAKVDRVIEGLIASGMPAERIALGGFSQGACLTSEYAATHPRKYAGLLIFTGGLIGPPGSDVSHAGDMTGTPVLIGNGDRDPHIPWARTLETVEVLRGMGAEVDVQQYPGRPHTISMDEIGRAKALLEKSFARNAV